MEIMEGGWQSLLQWLRVAGRSHTGPQGGERIQLFGVGFLAHIFGPREVVSCALECPGWKHEYALALEAEALADPEGAAPLSIEGGVACVRLEGWDVGLEIKGASARISHRRGRLVDGIPADYSNIEAWKVLDMLPDFTDFCIGARLARDWRQRRGILGTVRMSGGEFGTVPANYTFQRTWCWTGKSGSEHCQAIGDILHYTSNPGEEIALTFTARADGSSYRVPLKPNRGQPWIVGVVGEQMNWSRELDKAAQFELELAHAHATMRLCDMEGAAVGMVLAPESRLIPETKRPTDGPGLVEIRLPGRINCSGRQMTE